MTTKVSHSKCNQGARFLTVEIVCTAVRPGVCVENIGRKRVLSLDSSAWDTYTMVLRNGQLHECMNCTDQQ